MGSPVLLPGPNFLCLPPLYLFQCTCTWKLRQYLGLLCRSKRFGDEAVAQSVIGCRYNLGSGCSVTSGNCLPASVSSPWKGPSGLLALSRNWVPQYREL